MVLAPTVHEVGVNMLDNKSARAAIVRLVEPCARGLLRLGLTPDAVTIIGALGTSLAAVLGVARGHFLISTFVIIVLSSSDLLDGTMARMRGTAGPWGAFLDSTLDRVTDFALIGSIAYYFAFTSPHRVLSVLALASSGLALLTSYIRARAESVGASCTVGLIERAERLTIIQVSLVIASCGFPEVFGGTIPLLFIASAITVVQRIIFVRNQLKPGN